MAAGLFAQMFGALALCRARPACARASSIRSRSPSWTELGIDISRHKPITFEELEDLDGLNFDLIVTLSPEAHHQALELTRTSAADVEYWPTRRSDRSSRATASSGSMPIGRCATSSMARIRAAIFAGPGAGRWE